MSTRLKLGPIYDAKAGKRDLPKLVLDDRLCVMLDDVPVVFGS